MSQLIISAMIHQLMKWPIVSAANGASCASCALNVLAFTESSETSECIYFSFLLAFDVNFMLMNFNSLDVPVNIPIFTFFSVRSRLGP